MTLKKMKEEKAEKSTQKYHKLQGIRFDKKKLS